MPLRCYEFIFTFAAQKTSCKYLNTSHLTFTSSFARLHIPLILTFSAHLIASHLISHSLQSLFVLLPVDMNATRTPIQSRHIHKNISCSFFFVVVVAHPMETFNDENREMFIRYSAEEEK